MAAAPGLTWKSLFASPILSIGRCRCRPSCTHAAGEECSAGWSVVFVRSGVFVKHVRGERVVADMAQSVFFNPGEPYRVSHPALAGDDCAVFNLSEPTVRELLGVTSPRALEAERPPIPWTGAPADGRVYGAQHRLVDLLERGGMDALAVEEAALRLVRAALPARRDDADDGRRPDTREAHAALAERARVVLALEFVRHPSLFELARRVASSPYHLSRVFRRVTGLTLARYTDSLRVRAALGRVRDGGVGLSRLALESGFCDQSHMTCAFRREFGVTPGRLRAGATAREVREMSKLLQG